MILEAQTHHGSINPPAWHTQPQAYLESTWVYLGRPTVSKRGDSFPVVVTVPTTASFPTGPLYELVLIASQLQPASLSQFLAMATTRSSLKGTGGGQWGGGGMREFSVSFPSSPWGQGAGTSPGEYLRPLQTRLRQQHHCKLLWALGVCLSWLDPPNTVT